MNGEYERAPLPWSWAQKVEDFVKPGDRVLHLRGRRLEELSENSFDVILSDGPFRDYEAARRLLKPGGFFLTRQTGGEDGRALAEFLLPGSRPDGLPNLETELPAFRAAGFRVMYRNQAHPTGRFYTVEALLAFIASHPERFPGFSRERGESRLSQLERRLERDGFLENAEHAFIMIGKNERRA